MAYYPLATESGAAYALVAPDGSVATFNEPADGNYVGMLTEVTGLDSPEIRESAMEVVEGDGGVHGMFYFGRRPVVLNGRVFGHQSVVERNERLDRARRASLAMRGDSILSWKPSARTENWIENPTATVDTRGYFNASSGTSINRISSGIPGGYDFGVAWSGTVASTAAAVSVGKVTDASVVTGAFPVSPGVSYAARSSQRVVSVTSGAITNMQLRIYWYKSDGSQSSVLSSTSVTTVAAPALSTDYTMGGAAIAPSDAALAVPRMFLTITNPTTFNVRGSGFVFRQGTSIPAFADGTTAGWYWQGDAHGSASGDFIEQYVAVRRQQPFRESGAWVKDFQIPLVSERAYIYGRALKTTVAPALATNRGNAPALPVLRITGNTGGISGATVTINGVVFRTADLILAANETIEIDTETHTAKFTAGARNGQNANKYIWWSNTSWPVIPAYDVATAATLGGTGSGVLTLLYRDTWV